MNNLNQKITFVCHYNDKEILTRCLLKGGEFPSVVDEWLFMKDQESLAKAYAFADSQARNRLIVFVHQDARFKKGWRENLFKQIRAIEKHDPDWAVIGALGFSPKTKKGHEVFAGKFDSVEKRWRYQVTKLPIRVEVIDSFICVKKKGFPMFDPEIPNFHGAVEDICYRAATYKAGVWVADLRTDHLTPHTNRNLDKIIESAAYLKRKWGLPLVCGNVFWMAPK